MGKLAANDQIDRNFMFLKHFDPSELSAPGLYTCLCPLFSNISETAWSVKAKFYLEPPLEGRS